MVFGDTLSQNLNRIDGEPMEFEWTNFPGFTTLGILKEIQKMMAELKCKPEQFQGRILFMSMVNDIKAVGYALLRHVSEFQRSSRTSTTDPKTFIAGHGARLTRCLSRETCAGAVFQIITVIFLH